MMHFIYNSIKQIIEEETKKKYIYLDQAGTRLVNKCQPVGYKIDFVFAQQQAANQFLSKKKLEHLTRKLWVVLVNEFVYFVCLSFSLRA